MTLALYIARRFLTYFAGIFAVFFGILFMVDIVEEIRDYSDGGIRLGGAAHLALLNVPIAVYHILPLILILTAMALFIALARSSELVVIRAAGRSALRLLVSPFVSAFLVGALAVAVLNPIVAATTRQYETVASRYDSSNKRVLSVSREGLWLRQGSAEDQSVIRATKANLDGTKLFGVTVLTFESTGAPSPGPSRRIEADTAQLVSGQWDLTGVKQWNLSGSDNPERDAVTMDTLSIPSDLTADRIRDSFGTPAAIAIWDLPEFIAGLQRAGFSARRHQVWFQMELALPLMLASMVLVGAGFTMRHARFGKTGLMALFALSAGFVLYFLRNFAQVLGENGQIPVALAAWSPPVAAILFSVGLLLHLEDG